MSWFSRRRQYQHSDPEEEYRDALAAWQVDHNADWHDMTPDQRERMRLHTRCVDLGLDPNRVEYARTLVRRGEIDG